MAAVRRAMVDGLRFGVNSMVHRSLMQAVVRWAETSASAAAMRIGLVRLGARDLVRALKSWKAARALSSSRQALFSRAVAHIARRGQSRPFGTWLTITTTRRAMVEGRLPRQRRRKTISLVKICLLFFFALVLATRVFRNSYTFQVQTEASTSSAGRMTLDGISTMAKEAAEAERLRLEKEAAGAERLRLRLEKEAADAGRL
eukprot:3987576-Prymnesium_polylepis.1